MSDKKKFIETNISYAWYPGGENPEMLPSEDWELVCKVMDDVIWLHGEKTDVDKEAYIMLDEEGLSKFIDWLCLNGLIESDNKIIVTDKLTLL